jgi:hypothetical protein
MVVKPRNFAFYRISSNVAVALPQFKVGKTPRSKGPQTHQQLPCAAPSLSKPRAHTNHSTVFAPLQTEESNKKPARL